MLSIVMAALRSRRSSMVAPRSDLRAWPAPLVHVCTADAIAALAVGFAAAGPACMAAFGRGHAAAGMVAIAAATTAVVVLFASLAIFLVGGIRRSVPDADARPRRRRHGLPGGVGAGAVGAIGGLAIGGGVASTAPMDLVPITIGVGIASAAFALAACQTGAYLGHRRATGLRPATGSGRASDRRHVPGWIVAAGALVALAVVARHVGPVGADLVPYAVAGAVAFGAGGMLRPVARWIGCRAVRVTESAFDERPHVTVDGGSAANEATTRESARANETVDEPPADVRETGRFVRGTIAAAGYLARRPDLDHVIALAVAGIVIAGASTLGWTSGVTARHDRAAIELGADRVLTVAPISPARLVAGVRAADPTGRYAMAAVVTSASAAGGAVVAVDGRRLGAVVSGGVRSGPTGKQLATLLRDAGVPISAITGPETATGQSYDLPSPEAGAIKVTRLGSPVPGVPAGGILVDLGDGALPEDAGVTSEVWLASHAPPSLINDLSRHGLRIVAGTSVGARAAAYANQPAVAVARFQLLAGIVTLCCAALLIGAVTWAHRGARTVARGVGLAVAAWTAGVIGALVARHAGPDFATGFADGWARVPPPPLVGSAPFAVFALVSGLVLAAAVAAVGARRRPRSRVVNPPGPARPLDGRVGAGGRDRTDLAVGGAHGTVSAT